MPEERLEMTTTKKTLTKTQREYARIADRSLAGSRAEFTAAVKALLAKKGVQSPVEADYLKAAKIVRFTCKRCAGTGQFITGSMNGKPTGPGGACFRCGGKGAQNDADRRRNYGYDCRAFEKAAQSMVNSAHKSSKSSKSSGLCPCGEKAETKPHPEVSSIPLCGECWAENAAAAQHAKYALDDA